MDSFEHSLHQTTECQDGRYMDLQTVNYGHHLGPTHWCNTWLRQGWFGKFHPCPFNFRVGEVQLFRYIMVFYLVQQFFPFQNPKTLKTPTSLQNFLCQLMFPIEEYDQAFASDSIIRVSFINVEGFIRYGGSPLLGLLSLRGS